MKRDFFKDARKKFYDNSSESNQGESFIDEPSVKKLKDQIRIKDAKNKDLEDEMFRLKLLLKEHVGENDIISHLQDEMKIRENQMEDRYNDIKNLMEENSKLEQNMQEMKKQLDKLKSEQLAFRKKSIMMITATDRASLRSNVGEMLSLSR